MLTNYHTHNHFCDGQGSIEEYILTAIDKGFSALGFSSHAPIPVKNEWALTEENLHLYLEEIDRQKKLRNKEIQIYKGLEIDYIPGVQSPGDAKWKSLSLDYTIGSVHSTVGLDKNPSYACVDGPPGMFEYLRDTHHGGSMETMTEAYYTRICELVRRQECDILGHMDLIKKEGGKLAPMREDSPWYKRTVRETLDTLSGVRIIVEVNTGAIARGTLNEVYPAPWILAELLKRDIPVMINADAHKPEDIDCYFSESKKLLQDIGFRETMALIDGRWQAFSLS